MFLHSEWNKIWIGKRDRLGGIQMENNFYLHKYVTAIKFLFSFITNFHVMLQNIYVIRTYEIHTYGNVATHFAQVKGLMDKHGIDEPSRIINLD